MADYTDIDDNELMPDEPITSLLGFRFRNNPVAIAEGAPGAPRNRPGSLAIYLGTVVAPSATVAGLSDLDGIDVIRFSSGSSTEDQQFRTSTDNGATWSSWRTLLAEPLGSLGSILFGECVIALQSGWWSAKGVGTADIGGGAVGAVAVESAGTFTPGGVVNAVQFRQVRTIHIFGMGAGA